ncbi:hypothetical protein ACIPV2_13110 [Microbacterium sp. NPDC089987]|uniref:hypothetical protein n=1 Tax=Microbacterium sp. NPDC089987 TaxID=3364202 RepID=UPI00381BC4E3
MTPRQYHGDDSWGIIFGVFGSLLYVVFALIRLVVVVVATCVRRDAIPDLKSYPPLKSAGVPPPSTGRRKTTAQTGGPMKLTDDDLTSLFPYGMSVTQESHVPGDDPEDVIPLRGIVTPHDENPDWFNLWITDGANTVFTREVEPDGTGGYMNDRLGVAYRFFPLPESRQVIL